LFSDSPGLVSIGKGLFIVSGLITPLFYEPAKHLYKLITNERYRKYSFLESRFRRIPRFTECQVKVHGWNLSMPDSASFLSAYREIFVEQIYAFKFSNGNPSILDLGANIGLSVLFLKSLYPQAHITAFEADPQIFFYLQKNIHGNGFSDVELFNKAAWNENTSLKFSSIGDDAGRVALDDDESTIEVDAIDMAEFLSKNRFDFLKMDIEGAEEVVLPVCKDYLSTVSFIFVEYHSRVGRKQCLEKIINILSDTGFRIHIQSVIYSRTPFIKIETHDCFDLQLNIFGWRES
jgi:FkbM family methyltransferase